ncbi:hypothetical protein GCM10023310_15680 [Paenibacillus vulneris]|uniref:Uncharacterized protein n=1 Tax=Paenibacillus vulneris TaxID=1133364 RepID=A0ABW3UJ93_9BACL
MMFWISYWISYLVILIKSLGFLGAVLVGMYPIVQFMYSRSPNFYDRLFLTRNLGSFVRDVPERSNFWTDPSLGVYGFKNVLISIIYFFIFLLCWSDITNRINVALLYGAAAIFLAANPFGVLRKREYWLAFSVENLVLLLIAFLMVIRAFLKVNFE